MSRLPGFFKVLLLPKSSEQLLLPVALTAHLQGALPEQALLRNHYGKLWPVKITSNGKKFFFENGWAKFVDDNDVQNGDFLVFDYDGSRIFYIKLYGKSGCEKKIAETPNFGLKKEKEDCENKGMVELEDGRQSENEEDQETEEIEESDDDDQSYEGKEEYEESDEDEDDDDLGMEDSRKQEGKGKGKRCAEKLAVVTLSSDAAVEAKCEFGKSDGSPMGLEMVHASTKEKVEGASGNASDADEIFKFGMVSRPNTPYFVAKLRAKRTNELYIPLDVIRDHKLQFQKFITILDDENREWTSNIKIWEDGRTWLTNGWRAFRKWNDLKWEDRCLCEFIRDPGPRGLFLKIRILRVGSWLPKGDK